MIPVIKKAIIAKVYFCSPIASPPMVDVIIEGIFAIVEIKIYGKNFIGVKPATYEIRSFGVPGIKNKRNVRKYIFVLLCKNFIESIFSLGKKISTNMTPNFRARKNTIDEPIVEPKMQRKVPQIDPKE